MDVLERNLKTKKGITIVVSKNKIGFKRNVDMVLLGDE